MSTTVFTKVEFSLSALIEKIRLGEFLRLHGLEFFAAGLQFLESLNDRFRHAAMGFVRTADDGKLLGGSQAFVAVLVIEADAQQVGGLRFAATG